MCIHGNRDIIGRCKRKDVFAYPHAKFLIHKPYMASYDGDLDLENPRINKNQTWRVKKNKMLALYVERTGSEASVIEAQMNKAGWFGGETAKQLGFITTVLMPTTAKGRTYTFNNKKMNKEKEVTVKQTIIDRLLAKCGYQKN